MKQFTRDVLARVLANLAPLLLVSLVTLFGAIVFRDPLTTALFFLAAIWLLAIYVILRRQKPRIVRTSSTRSHAGPFRFPRLRPWALVALIALPIVSLTLWLALREPPHDGILILLAQFDGPDPQTYQVTNVIFQSLTEASAEDKTLLVRLAGKSFTDSESARSEGTKQGADVVVWGWYGKSAEVVPLSVHFEVIGDLESIAKYCPAAKGKIRLLPATDLESFVVQTDLSSELAYLGLFTSGLSHLMESDWELAVAAFDTAIQQAPPNVASWPVANAYYVSNG